MELYLKIHEILKEKDNNIDFDSDLSEDEL